MKKILIVIKHSKYEWEMKTFNLTDKEIKEKYISEHANYKAIMDSHNKQLAVRRAFMRAFNNSLIIMADKIEEHNLDIFDLVIVVGGDNIFCKISHHVGNVPILGVNSDPERSVGCLTQWAINTDRDVFDLAEIIDSNKLNTEEWTRLQATVDGRLITPATSEYFFGERMRKDMSRHILIYKNKEYLQKCSGIIISTGAGSTGWYRSSNSLLKTWPATKAEARFVVTEPYNKNVQEDYTGIISATHNEEIIIHSLNDSEGIVSIDSWDEFDFPRGATAKVFLGNVLYVARPIIEIKKDIVSELI